MTTVTPTHYNIRKTSISAFSFVALLIAVCSLLIYLGLNIQNNMLQVSAISYEQRILLERVNQQVKFLIENNQPDILTERVIRQLLTDIASNQQQIHLNQQALERRLFGNFQTRQVIGLHLIQNDIQQKLQTIANYMALFNNRIEEIQQASIPALQTGYNFWKPVDTLIDHDGALLKAMSELNTSVYQATLALNYWLYLLYGSLLVLVLTGLWLIWYFTLHPLAEKLKTYYQEITDKNSILTYQTMHDPLTGLLNRATFNQHINQLTEKNQLYCRTALILMDVDNFKGINDNFGHQGGDQVLQQIAKQLTKTLLPNEQAYRVAGDEFALVLQNISNKGHALSRVEAFSQALELINLPENLAPRATCSMGVAWGKKCGSSLEEMFNAADAALYNVKGHGRGHFQFFGDISPISVASLLRQDGQLHQAVQNREFIVHYQPIIQLDSNEIIGFEALARWQHPTRGIIPPHGWIASADRLSLTTAITCQIMDLVTHHRRTWHKTGLPSAAINVNITESMLINGLALHKFEAAQAEKQSPEIGVEVTESIFFDRSLDKATEQLQRIREAGIKISLDDFGTGFANLSHLRRIPFDTLKLDCSFTSTILHDESMWVIVKSLIEMSAGLNKQIICEGVESHEIHCRLLELGCNYAQGFFYSRPLPFEQLHTLGARFSPA